MRADLGDWLGRHIFVTGEYEPDTTRVIVALLNRGDSFLDVGANAGYFTLLGSRCVGFEGHVCAVEALPSARARLEANISLNKLTNCDVIPFAASNCCGKLTFYPGPTDHIGISSLRRIKGGNTPIEVNSTPLDQAIDEHRRFSLVKIDIEGAELNALEGLSEMLRRCRPYVVLEVTQDFLHEMGRSSDDLDAFFRERGYTFFKIVEGGIKRIESLCSGPGTQFNALCVPNDLPAILANLVA